MSNEKIVLSNGMEFMPVPAGRFLMGSTEDGSVYANERPQHLVEIPYDYWMARFTVTNEQYHAFDRPSRLRTILYRLDRNPNYPIINVTWVDAMKYCRWLNDSFKSELPAGWMLRLPTEAEWEKAARGTDGRIYPWGDEFGDDRGNFAEGERMPRPVLPAGQFSPQGDSPYGCSDMAGNVWEWTHSLMKPYPYNANDGREQETDRQYHVVRGGSAMGGDWAARCANRVEADQYMLKGYFDIGIRVCLAPPL
ncbi:MAG: formylglycine-generating enzyme family protein [Anaerolineales bacterium]